MSEYIPYAVVTAHIPRFAPDHLTPVDPMIFLGLVLHTEPTVDQLVAIAQMGVTYAKRRYGNEEIPVGLVSIGEEDKKGNSLTRDTNALLRKTPALLEEVGGTFTGNIEGRDLSSSPVDVAVTDGFTGEVARSAREGVINVLAGALTSAFDSAEEAEGAVEVLGPGITRVFDNLKAVDYTVIYDGGNQSVEGLDLQTAVTFAQMLQATWESLPENKR